MLASPRMLARPDLKHWHISTKLHGVTAKNTVFLRDEATRSSCHTKCRPVYALSGLAAPKCYSGLKINSSENCKPSLPVSTVCVFPLCPLQTDCGQLRREAMYVDVKFKSVQVTIFDVEKQWVLRTPSLYSKTCLKRNAIVPVFFFHVTGFRFTKGCVLIKQSTKNMIA